MIVLHNHEQWWHSYLYVIEGLQLLYFQLYGCTELQTYCEAFFLQRLPALVTDNAAFCNLAFSPQSDDYELVQGLLVTLTAQLLNKQLQFRQEPRPTSCKPPLPHDRDGVVLAPVSSRSSFNRESPAVTRESPSFTRHSPSFARESPALTRESPSFARESPALVRESPSFPRELPALTRHSPVFTTTRDTPSPARYSPAFATNPSTFRDLTHDSGISSRDSCAPSHDSSMTTRDYNGFSMSGSNCSFGRTSGRDSFHGLNGKPFIAMSSQV